MPRGFDDIPSGSDLPPTLQLAAPRFLDFLKRYAKEGKVTIEKPMTAKVLAEKYNTIYGTNLTDVSVRAIVNFLRISGEPICAVAKGYFYPRSQEEAQSTIDQLSDRLSAIANARAGVVTGSERLPSGT